MRRNEREITDVDEMEGILAQAQVCRIALVDGERPYIVPVNFGYAAKALYFHSAVAGAKLDILKRNNRACFEAEADAELVRNDLPCKWGIRYRSVIGFGTASIIEADTEKRQALDVIMAHYAQGPFEYIEESLARMLVVKVDIETMTGKKSGW